jgi:hypothetical protein
VLLEGLWNRNERLLCDVRALFSGQVIPHQREVVDKYFDITFPIVVGSSTKNRRGMQRGKHRRQINDMLDHAVALPNSELRSKKSLSGDRAEADDQIRSYGLKFRVEPRPACMNLLHTRLFVKTQFAPGLPAKVFHRIGDVNQAPIDRSLFQTPIEKSAGRTDERLALAILLVSRLFADHHHRNLGPRGTPARFQFTENTLRSIAKQIAAPALLNCSAQQWQVAIRRDEIGGAWAMARVHPHPHPETLFEQT